MVKEQNKTKAQYSIQYSISNDDFAVHNKTMTAKTKKVNIH